MVLKNEREDFRVFRGTMFRDARFFFNKESEVRKDTRVVFNLVPKITRFIGRIHISRNCYSSFHSYFPATNLKKNPQPFEIPARVLFIHEGDGTGMPRSRNYWPNIGPKIDFQLITNDCTFRKCWIEKKLENDLIKYREAKLRMLEIKYVFNNRQRDIWLDLPLVYKCIDPGFLKPSKLLSNWARSMLSIERFQIKLWL